MDTNETPPEQEQPQEIVKPPQIIITVLPSLDLDIRTNEVTPVTMIGAAEILKGMALAMIQGVQNAGLVKPSPGVLDHLDKKGFRPS